MTLPAEIAPYRITFQGKVERTSDGTPYQGTVKLTASPKYLQDATSGITFVPDVETDTIAPDGTFDVLLIPSNLEVLNPHDDWTWHCEISLTGVAAGKGIPAFDFPVDKDQPGKVLELVDVLPGAAPNGGTWVPMPTVGGTVLISTDAGNVIEQRANGLYASGTGGGGGGVPSITAVEPVEWDADTGTISAPTAAVVDDVTGKLDDSVIPADVAHASDIDALQSAIDGKADNGTVDDLAAQIAGFVTADTMNNAIAAALTDYATTADITAAIEGITPADIGAVTGALAAGGVQFSYNGTSLFIGAGTDPATVVDHDGDVWIDES